MADELIDVLDEHGNLTGQTAMKREVHATGLWHRTAWVWVVNPATHELLIQKTAATKQAFPNKWALSTCGHIRASETARTTAVRELAEEIGLEALADDLTYLFTETFEFERSSIRNKEHFDVFLIESTRPIEEFQLQPDEVAELRWITLPDLKAWIDRSPDDFTLSEAETRELFRRLPRYFEDK